MKTFSTFILAVCAMAVTLAHALAQTDSKPPDPCSLMTKAEAAAVMGEIKGEPRAKDGLRNQKCTYYNMKGAWITIEVYPAGPHWDLLKQLAIEVQDLTGLGDAAFSAKRGVDTRQVYVKKGALMVEVESSAGMEAAQKVAEIAAKRLP